MADDDPERLQGERPRTATRAGSVSSPAVDADLMTLVLEGTGTGFWEWDMRADVIRWSDNVGPLYGLERGAQPGGYGDYLRDVVLPASHAQLDAKVRAAVERGEDYTHDSRIVLRDGRERWLHSRAHVLRDAQGRPALLVGLITDITESRQRELAAMFLAEATEALASTLDPAQTLAHIARLAVPRLADWCAVQLATDDGGAFENLAVAHVDPDKARWARELQERYPPDPDAPTGVPQVLRSGRSELYPTIDEDLLRAAARDEEHLRIVQELQMQSAMVVPLRARERVLGAITFIYAESGRRYGTTELELAEELGRRAGLALDHARLYTREHGTAETLQRALLPAELPDIDGFELAVRYQPSRAGDHAGGDWYDAFRLPDGRIGIAVGDVGGRGMEAAARMGQLRSALRAYAVKARMPGEVIDDLHALVDALADGVFATVAYVVLEPDGTGCVAVAGHPPPLIVAPGGSPRYLDLSPVCPPLGAAGAAASREHAFVLEPGATLVLYTDGLVETRGGGLEDGLTRIAAAAAARHAGVGALADAVLAAGVGGGEDDVALLALRRLSA